MKLLRSWLAARRARGEAIQREAEALILFLGHLAYPEARSRARTCRAKGDHAGDRYWSKVAVTIADRTGHEVGLKAADRYEAAARDPRRVRYEAAVALAARELLAGLGRLAQSGDATELHNVRAQALQTVDLAPGRPDVASAVADVIRRAENLARYVDASARQIGAGLYPAELSRAGEAVERLRQALCGAYTPTVEH